ncbi:beta-lactamase/transpeptidase-like protein [Crucibulum laeve]|uniref:Beta-lactamase/transpeptidase-like protein n=1 Tax=Crucibulum laeve TaxID=68775 RepID=A0A5C3LVD9_9AGAR|nr:beta-lactamase/transpeptidase-like protein [Crucibulum laeve]
MAKEAYLLPFDYTVSAKRPLPSQRHPFRATNIGIVFICSIFAVATFLFFRDASNVPSQHMQSSSANRCRFPLPNLLASSPPHASDEEIVQASNALYDSLSKQTSQEDIDSLSIAVVTPTGSVFEYGFGVLRANETDVGKQGKIDKDSIYRIASISKMFTVLETLILRERGILSWDDPIQKFIPELSYPSYGWSEYLSGNISINTRKAPRITVRQLASHMSGIGRDYPPVNFKTWPNISPWETEIPPRSYKKLLSSIAKYPLVNFPYQFPVYSNAGFDLLGLTNVAANKIAEDSADGPDTHKDLLKRDIFDPMGLNGSFYRIPSDPTLRGHIAVPSKDPEWADFLFDDSDDPAGGQYSSLSDLSIVMRTILSPTAEGGVVSEHVIREWLHPLYDWSGGIEQVGAPWEIKKLNNQIPLYTKGGNLPGYHTQFALNPQFGYGVISLATGTYSNSAAFVADAFSHFQPAFEGILEKRVRDAYVGKWVNDGNTGIVSIIDGGLFVEKLVIRGVDILAYVQDTGIGLVKKSSPVALMGTREGEFRLAFGRADINDTPEAGCIVYWATFDPFNGRDAPIDLIYWEGDELVYPSGGVRLRRV